MKNGNVECKNDVNIIAERWEEELEKRVEFLAQKKGNVMVWNESNAFGAKDMLLRNSAIINCDWHES